MDSMYDNKVWSLVDFPEGIKFIGCEWVIKKKIDMDGKMVTYNVRSMTKGYNQRQGSDFEETFLLVTMLKSIHILLSIVAYFDYEIWQMNVKIAFLNENFKKEVYMTQPKILHLMILIKCAS